MLMNEPESDPEEEIEELIDMLECDDEKLTFGFYSQMRSHKDYCSNMQNRYRALASTWLLAAFAGMGFLISGNEGIQLPFNTLLGVIALSVFSGFGITLLWFLDVVLYQRLWDAVVVELAQLEKKHHWLPRVNLNTLLIKESKRFPVYQSFFYIGINGIFVFISSLVTMYYFSGTLVSVCLITLVMSVVVYLIMKCMLKYSGELERITIKSFEK